MTSSGSGGTESNNDDDEDDDFDEEDDDEDDGSKKQKNLKQGDMAKLGCSFRQNVNSQYIKPLEMNFKDFVSFQNHHMVQGFMSSFNEWYPMLEKWMSQQVVCSGFEYKEPLYYFEDERLVFSYDLGDTPETGDYCEQEFYVTKSDPRALFP
jgi:hypothetical protein